jgi:DNA polymerase elongation subunit (family B)
MAFNLTNLEDLYKLQDNPFDYKTPSNTNKTKIIKEEEDDIGDFNILDELDELENSDDTEKDVYKTKKIKEDRTMNILKKRRRDNLYGKVGKDVIFQILDIGSYDAEIEDDEDDEDSYGRDNYEKNKYHVPTLHFNMIMYGKTAEDKTVCLNVKNFKPFFYVEIDSTWTKHIVNKIVNKIKYKIYKKNRKGLIKYEIVEKHKFKGFTNDENFKFIKLTFDNYKSLRSYKNKFEEEHQIPEVSRHIKVKFKLYESNLHPLLRMFHVKNQLPNGWCKIKKENMLEIDEENDKTGVCDYNLSVDWNNLESVDCSDIHKFKILSFDIECTSEDGKFPQATRNGDKVIQIGMTYSLVGKTECLHKEVLCLKDTDDIPGAQVICYRTERELLLGFTNRLQYHDPDIITGYNIFGFDYKYLHDRAKKFNILEQFSRLSRMRGNSCRFVEQNLQSSALGRNFMSYFDISGRISIDLMKVVQRDYKLKSYKLDFVAQTFVRGDIVDYKYIKKSDKEYEKYKKIENTKEEFEFVKTKKDVEQTDKSTNHKYQKQLELKHMMDNYSSDEDEDDNIDDIREINPYIQKISIPNDKQKIEYTVLKVKSTFGVKVNDYVSIFCFDGSTDNRIGKKKKILDIDHENNTITLKEKIRVRPFIDLKKRGKRWDIFWAQAKDDVEPKDIFRLYEGNSKDKAIVAKYCLKDCSLCNRLMAKLQIVPNSIGMANVCSVPLSYLFLRGQGVKIFSLVAKQCAEENYLIPDTKKKPLTEEEKEKLFGKKEKTPEQEKKDRFKKFLDEIAGKEEDSDDEDEKYEGATVFDPVKGVHYEPVIVDDYGSLYPSSMIMKNLSHNSIVLDDKYLGIKGYKYHTQSYNNQDGTVTTYQFAERLDGIKATIPRILMKLLAERKKCKKLKAVEKDPFKKAIWDGLQLAYKVTANSLYGQCGSKVSPISMKPIAACTTAIGREMLELARDYVEKTLPRIINLMKDAIENGNEEKYLRFMSKYFRRVKNEDVIAKDKYNGKKEYFNYVKNEMYKLLEYYDVNPQCIYGDTDSVFFKLNLTYKYDDKEKGIKSGDKFNTYEALDISIKVGMLSSEIVNYTLDSPQVLEYEKTFYPFIILTKKRYVGNKYEFDSINYKQNSMGLVTKRRDNADIVKDAVGGIIDQILNYQDPMGAINLVQNIIKDIITGRYDIEKFIITKTLKDKESYADWKSQAHVVLADRITERDPGNKPQSNERLEFVYIELDRKIKIKLQGERVEHPKYIIEKNLKIDYAFYITNQIMKPSLQFLELIVKNPAKIFQKFLKREINRKRGTAPIMKYLYNNLVNEDVNSLQLINKNLETFEEEMNVIDEKQLHKKINRQRKRKKRVIK